MSFELAAIIVVAALAVVLGLVCYHLLGRLDMLERAVQGGLEPPTSRLSREQFERRFKIAHARSQLAKSTGTGLVVVVGPEHTPDSDLRRTIEHLARPDLVTVATESDLSETPEALGITSTPFLFVIDDQRVRSAQPIASADDLRTYRRRLHLRHTYFGAVRCPPTKTGR